MALGTSLSGSGAHAFDHSDPFPRAWSRTVSCQSGAHRDLLHPSLRAGPRNPPLKQAPAFKPLACGLAGSVPASRGAPRISVLEVPAGRQRQRSSCCGPRPRGRPGRG